MKKIIQLNLILIVLSIISCQKQDGYVIRGDLTGFPDSTMFYLANLSTAETFDSTMIIDGNFQLSGQLQDEPEQIRLITKIDNESIHTNLLIGNETVEIMGDIKDFPWNVNITGSQSQNDFNYLRDLTKSFHITRDSMVQSFLKLTPEERDTKWKQFWHVDIKALDDTIQTLRISYIKSHLNTYTGIINLGYLKNTLPKDTLQALYSQLNEEIKASKYAKIVDIYLNAKISKKGDHYHDFKALSNKGDTVSFSDVTGKYVLLDFTSAYCGPCMQSVEELRLIDKTYSDSLVIVSFSGDVKKDVWLNSLERDSVSWMSLWDGKGRYSEPYIKYGVQGVPSFFLIDTEGKIIKKWSGYCKGSLEKKLKRFKIN